MTAKNETDNTAFKTKFSFGLGASADNAINWVFGSLAFFYYQQILGLSGALAGSAVAIALFADAITDPLVGSISDRFRSRWGRRHPFMFFAPIPLAVVLFLIFHPPETVVASEMALFAWFATFTVLLRTFQTIFAIPMLALGAELSKNYLERSKIMSYESLLGLYGYVFMHIVAVIGVFGMLFVEEGGRLYQAAYTPIVLICCAFSVLTMMMCAFGTKDQIPKLKERQVQSKKLGIRVFLSDIWVVFKNPNYRALLFGNFFGAVAWGTHEVMGVYMATFFWELSANQWGMTILGSIVGTHIAFAVTPSIHKKIDKRWSVSIGCALMAVFWSAAPTLKIMGIGPESGTWLAVWWIVFLKIFSVCGGVLLTISVMSALADIADEHELATGQRQEGIFYAARTFFSKATQGAGTIIAGLAMDYYVKLPPQSAPGEVAQDVLFRLGVIDGPFAMLWGILAAFIYFGHKIDKKRYAEIRAELDRRALKIQPDSA